MGACSPLPPPSPPLPPSPPASPSPPSPPPSPPSPPPYSFANRNALDGALEEFNYDAASAIALYGPIAHWGVSAITDMSELFKDMASFNADISGWNTAGVTDMSHMFEVCSARASAPTWIQRLALLHLSSPRHDPLCSWPPHLTTPPVHPRTVGCGCVQPAAEFRHVQRHHHGGHVSGALGPCPAPSGRPFDARPPRSLHLRRPTRTRLPACVSPASYALPLPLGSKRMHSTSR